MLLDSVRPWIELAIVLWNVGLTAAVWLRKPGEDAGRAVKELRDDMDDKLKTQGSQITEMRTHMQHMPTNDELLELEGSVKEISERTAGLQRNMDAVRASLTRIEDYLLRSADRDRLR